MIRPVVLYEWIDCQGEVEDFIIFDIGDDWPIRKVFDFPNTKWMICYEEEAEALRLDYEEEGE